MILITPVQHVYFLVLQSYFLESLHKKKKEGGGTKAAASWESIVSFSFLKLLLQKVHIKMKTGNFIERHIINIGEVISF